MRIQGHLLAAGKAARYPAELELGDQGRLRLCSEVLERDCALSEVIPSEALGRMTRTLAFEGGWVFTPAEPQALNAWLDCHDGRSWLARAEQHLWLVLLAMMVTVVAAFGGYRYGLPALAKTLAGHVPHGVYRALGKQSYKLLDKMGFSQSGLDEARRQQLRGRFEALLAALKAQGETLPVEPRLVFRSFEQGPNAFALPDGTVVLTDQLVALSKDDRELDGVLLHELGHLHYHHMMTRLVQASLLSIGAAIAVGDSSSIADTLVGSGTLLMTLSYSRDHERQADHFAADNLYHLDGTVAPLRDLYQALLDSHKGENGLPVWSSTHPQLAERIQALAHFKPQ
ncbi:M48 family metallopeptidase [Gallaecimonas kandeliae]|uniref:M48 family metallopeptidase n=1 Tax=Gallaecimonas kandeliae TaxID=3029055 RepID=UPI002647D4F0|nr:M48 family metallopeptidase [Gallaecimonas kandeliae]WKE65399.1 M48 family metallopeptidase [Gallaecimonas kandeliae]